MNSSKTRKLTFLAMMIALDVVLSPLFRIEGMAPMSSVVNILAAVLMGPVYALIMAVCCALIRMTMMGIPPLALTGATFGAGLAGLLYKWWGTIWAAMLGEFIGTGLIGSFLSYPLMVLYTGSTNRLFWFVYTPKFVGATLIGGVIAYFVYRQLIQTPFVLNLQRQFYHDDVQ